MKFKQGDGIKVSKTVSNGVEFPSAIGIIANAGTNENICNSKPFYLINWIRRPGDFNVHFWSQFQEIEYFDQIAEFESLVEILSLAKLTWEDHFPEHNR